MNNIANLVEKAIKDYVGAVHFIRFLKEENIFRNQKIGVVVREIIGANGVRYDPGSVVIMEFPTEEQDRLLIDEVTAETRYETLSVYQLAKKRSVEMWKKGDYNFFGRVDNVPSQYVQQLDLKELMKFMDAAFTTNHHE